MAENLTLKSARDFAGAVSISNSKMPGGSFALATSGCNVGGLLKAVEGSVCHACYAVRLEKLRPHVLKAWTHNLDRATACMGTRGGRAAWTAAMIVQIRWAVERTGEPFFRWFDSGDLPAGQTGLAMLHCICNVARAMPAVRFWLPTREARTLSEFIGPIPDNLVVRLSAPMVDGAPFRIPRGMDQAVRTSTVHRKGADHVGHACPARAQGNQCGSCRACWDGSVVNVSYPKH